MVAARLMALAGIVAGVLAAGQAKAQEGDAAAAEALFREGRRLLDAKDYAAACPKLAESFRIDPATGTLLALAICHEDAGRTASAWSEYTDVAARSRRDGRPDREEAARARAAALDAKLSFLTVAVPDAIRSMAGLTVKRDGVLLGQASWGVPLPVDPGEHVIDVTADGKRPAKQSVIVGEVADKRVLEVTALEDVPRAAAVVVAPAAAGPAVPAPDASPRPGPNPMLRTAGIITAGVGVAGLGISGLYAMRAKSKLNESNEQGCDASNHCRGAGTTLRRDALAAGNVATVALVVGGVLAAGGATLFIVGSTSSPDAPSGAPASARAVRAAPFISTDQAGVCLWGRL